MIMINTKTFTNVIKELEGVQKSIFYLDIEHRDLIKIRLSLLNEKLSKYGISKEDLEKIDKISDLESRKSKVESYVARKEEEVNKIKKEIMLSHKVEGKKEQRQKNIQLNRVDRTHKETKNDF